MTNKIKLLEGREVRGELEASEPGDFWFAGANFLNDHAEHHPKEYWSLMFRCPQCGEEHGVPIKPGSPSGWDWNGSVDKPTLSPSILISGGHVKNRDCRWHGYLRDGNWETV